MTTRDNLDVLCFYQRRGFHICAVCINSVQAYRKLKPQIAMAGDYNIPLPDEVDLKWRL